MNQVQVIDDFIDKDYQEEIKNVLLSEQSYFPWYFISDITYSEDDVDCQSRPALIHEYVHRERNESRVVSDFQTMFNSLLRSVCIELNEENLQILQARSFLQFPTLIEAEKPDSPHVDLGTLPHTVALYYVLDSDGDTIIYNERVESEVYTIKQRVTPKQGRIVLFDGLLYHTAEQPNKNLRCIVNYDLVGINKV